MPTRPARLARRRVQRYLGSLTTSQQAALEREMRRAIVEWDAEGFAFVGRPPRMRLTVMVRKKLSAPRRPVGTIRLPRSLGGIDLKVAVRALHRDGGRALAQRSAVPVGGGISYLAPGVPVLCDGARIGIGCVLTVDDRLYIVTCGHTASSSSSTLTTLDGRTDIATLATNYFLASEKLDAAIYVVSGDGESLLERGAAAATWCDDIHDPEPTDNDTPATFWPTWRDGAESFVEAVESYSACVPAGTGCGYVMLTRCTTLGDSGSSLQIDGAYYALASQRDGNSSFFTPLAAVVARLETGASVAPWRP